MRLTVEDELRRLAAEAPGTASLLAAIVDMRARPSVARSRSPGGVDGAGIRSLAVVAVVVVAVVLAGCASEAEDEAVIARGEALYQTHCVDCHGGATGGDISDIPPPHNAEGHTWHHADCELVGITLEGLPQSPERPEMPAFGDELTEAEVRTILAYIKTWWEPDQLAHQAEVTEQICD
jgi:mono/diheme cytochrome c family protein